MQTHTKTLVDILNEESQKTFLSVRDASDDTHASYLRGKAMALKNASLMVEIAIKNEKNS